MTIAPTSSGRPPFGMILPMVLYTSTFSPPWGYIGGRILISISFAPAESFLSCSIASGLLLSIPMINRLTPRCFLIASIPRNKSSPLSRIVRVSEVMYGSHSAALITTASILLRSLTASLTKVGKPAPPKPTIPLFFTASTKLSKSLTTGFAMLSSASKSPSESITTAGTFMPPDITSSSIFCTVPETLEWTGAEINPFASPISVPTLTGSPRFTVTDAGLPMCIDIGIVTVPGSGSCSGTHREVFFLCGTFTP